MLTAHDGVIYDPNLKHGLQRILLMVMSKKESADLRAGWPEWRKARQRQVACWVQRMSLGATKPPADNVAVLQRHLDHLQSEPRVLLAPPLGCERWCREPCDALNGADLEKECGG